MIIVRGSARARSGMRQALADAVLAVAAATEHDDGCMVYEFSVDLLDAEIIRNVEVWRDQKALDEHMTHDHTITFMAAVGDLVDGQPQMHIVSAG